MARSAGSRSAEHVAEVHNPGKPGPSGQRDQAGPVVLVGGRADPGDQHPHHAHAVGLAPGHDLPVHVFQDGPAVSRQGILVKFKRLARFGPALEQGLSVLRGIPAQAPGQEPSQAVLVPAEVGGGGLVDHQVGPGAPGEPLEVLPALAGGVAGDGEVPDLDGRIRLGIGPPVEPVLHHGFERLAVIHAPTGGDGVAHQADPDSARRLFQGVFAVPHAERVGGPPAAFEGLVNVRPEHELTKVVDHLVKLARMEDFRLSAVRVRGGEGRGAEVVEPATGVENLLVIAPFHPSRCRRGSGRCPGGCGPRPVSRRPAPGRRSAEPERRADRV